MPNLITDELLDAIGFVESSNNPLAVNKETKARGLMQFLPIGWEDVRQNYPELSEYDYETYAFDPDVSKVFARNLLTLNARRLKDKATIDNLLASYNYGIGNILKGKPLPKETREYIKKVKKRYADNLQNREVNSLTAAFGLTERR